MRYEFFLQLVKEDLEKRLGDDYIITLQTIPKNNGVIRDGLSISKTGESVSPTIYLNDWYQKLLEGEPLPQICHQIHQLYLTDPNLPYLDSQVLSSYESVKEHIAYKLINTQANGSLLKKLPHIPFHDMSLICYLLMKQHENSYITAFIYKEHLKAWKIREKELFLAAIQNTPRLLPPVIQPMNDVLKQLSIEMLGDSYQDTPFDILLEAATEYRIQENTLFPTLYVLTNPVRINGAACMAYPHVVKDFAESRNQDIIILPSSIHEVLLVEDDGHYDYEDMSRLVGEINRSEVPPEDRLSNQVYRYSRESGQITVVSHGTSLAGITNQ